MSDYVLSSVRLQVPNRKLVSNGIVLLVSRWRLTVGGSVPWPALANLEQWKV